MEEAAEHGVRGVEPRELFLSFLPFVRSIGWSSLGLEMLRSTMDSGFLGWVWGAATAALSAMLWLSLERRLSGSWFDSEGLAALPK